MKKFLVFIMICMAANRFAIADEGMWLPFLLNQVNMEKMQEMGLQLSAKEIYNINESSLKDAIVIFGGGCTGEIISDQGLLLTNMHCGYRQVQSHSTVEHDYLKNGFWAEELNDELPNPGLNVKFLVRVEDISEKVNNQLSDDMSENERSEKIKILGEELSHKMVEGTQYQSVFKSYYGGNQFYILIYETYSDVRLVANPPVSIGDFGSLTDNWMWPRHKADFSMFRVYTGPDGKPAEYSPDNIPLKPKHHLPISLKGVQPDDFAMILGNPGSTDRFMTTFGIKELMDFDHPNRIKIRGAKLEIMNETMAKSPAHRIMYAAKYKGASNYWKYSIAQMAGFERNHVLEQRKKLEKDFIKWVSQDANRIDKYGETLKLIKEGYESRKEFKNASQYISETMRRGPETIGFAHRANELYNELNKNKKSQDIEKLNALNEELANYGKKYYRDYLKETDQKIATALFQILKDDLDGKFYPEYFIMAMKEYDGNVKKFVDNLYNQSIFANEEAFNDFIKKPKADVLAQDALFQLAMSVEAKYNDLYAQSKNYDEQLLKGHRLFVKGVMEMEKDGNFYPDANFTMRLTYGKVGGYSPRDAVYYKHYTTLKGVMEKEDPNNYEFIVPEKLKQLYITKDYGRYAYNDEMHVCFITDNDITGGNSGSPVVNGNGELIGLAFDSNWEGMTGDIEFEEEMQKTVCTDIKYIVWLLEKFLGAQRIVDEMTFVE
ncbi:MAG: serine protease [Marinilabiliales bacterium]|nr:MAG: serine protease [Marinilabiliales bacterium]